MIKVIIEEYKKYNKINNVYFENSDKFFFLIWLRWWGILFIDCLFICFGNVLKIFYVFWKVLFSEKCGLFISIDSYFFRIFFI